MGQTTLVRRGAGGGPRHPAAMEWGYVKESAAGAKNGAAELTPPLLHAARSGSEYNILFFYLEFIWKSNHNLISLLQICIDSKLSSVTIFEPLLIIQRF
jgi:hypothetical protein